VTAALSAVHAARYVKRKPSIGNIHGAVTELALDMVSQQIGLNLAVIIWQSPATGALIEYDPWTKGIYNDDILYTTNPSDGCAVEEALRIRDSNGRGSVTVIAIGPERVEDALCRYLAMGADNAVRIERQAGHYDVYSLCAVIAGVVRDKHYDVILCGAEVTDGYGCQSYPGPFLAGMLGLPQVSGVTKIEAGDKEAVVHRRLEHGDREIVRCPLPCVLAVDTGCNEPRYASFTGLIESRRKAIITWDPESPGLASQSPVYSGGKINFVAPHKRVKKNLTIDTMLSAADRVKMIMSGGLAQKGSKDQLLKGDVHKMARDLITVFQKRGIMRSEK
jgi:electron transfer flavoprotein beta subunit